MAIANTTQWAVGTAIRDNYQPGFVQTVYYNNEFLSLFPVVSQFYDTSYRWKAMTAGNTSAETFTESQSQPVPVASTYVNAALAFVYFRAMMRITGHVRDAVAQSAGEYAGLSLINQEFENAQQAIIDLMNTTFLGTGNSGLQLAVDSSGTYAGLLRSTYTTWASYEAAVNTTLSHSDLTLMRESLRDNDIGGKMTLVLAPHNQITNIQALTGAPGASNTSLRYDLTQSGGALQLAPTLNQTMFGEARCVGVGDLTDTVIFGLDPLADGGIKTVVHRELDVRPDISGDDDVYQVSTSATLVVPNPKLQGKLTGVTA